MSLQLTDAVVERIAGALRAGLAEFSQTSRLLRLHTTLATETLIAERFSGSETLTGLSPALATRDVTAGFRYEIVALSTDAHITPDGLLGQSVLLELLCADSRTELRPFHGHVTQVEQLGSNGGFARYRLVIEPWLAFLAHRRDAYLFQDKTVIEIVDELFGDYRDQGALVPAWRWQLADASVYPKRSLTIQYRETDLAFVLRLLADEGLFGWFEHAGNADAGTLGSHTFVIADANTAFTNDLGTVRFHRADTTEADDTLQRLDDQAAVGTQSVALSSWDYLSLDVRLIEQTAADDAGPDASQVPMLTHRDTPGLYRYADRRQGSRLARAQARAHAVDQRSVIAAGSLRRMGVGKRFTVSGHARVDASALSGEPEAADYVALRVHHAARNNIPAAFSQGLDRLMNAVSIQPVTTARDDSPLYANEALLLQAAVAFAPRADLRRQPIVHGLQTATVVGGDGAPITTDRDHRIKVQFHWQRGARSQSRLDHPAGDDNAPGSEASGTWVRVAASVAGSNWGSVFVPRVGQEVLVEFIEGDIDRPVVIGSVYNGKGHDDAPGNTIGQSAPAATANAPAWFSGNGHPGALSGLKTQALSSSQSGQGGFNHLLLDATPAQARFDLATTQHATQLLLGHQRAQDGNLRAAPLGHGISLATDAYGSIRAGTGLLISADTRAGGTHASAQAFDAREAIQQLSEAEQLAQSLADTAKKQTAVTAVPSSGSASPPSAATSKAASRSGDGAKRSSDIPAIAALQHGQTVLQGTTDASTGLAWTEPMITTSAPDGIVALTPDASLWSAGTHLSLTAGHAIEAIAQADHRTVVKNGIVLFSYGNKPAAGSPEPMTGIQLHAAQGPVSLQAQSSTATLAARQELRIASTTASVTMQAQTHILLTAQGAYIRMQGGNIEVHAPGNVSFKGASKRLAGPQSVSTPQPLLPRVNLVLQDYKRKSEETYPLSL